jgi:hypothetical protein
VPDRLARPGVWLRLKFAAPERALGALVSLIEDHVEGTSKRLRRYVA